MTSRHDRAARSCARRPCESRSGSVGARVWNGSRVSGAAGTASTGQTLLPPTSPSCMGAACAAGTRCRASRRISRAGFDAVRAMTLVAQPGTSEPYCASVGCAGSQRSAFADHVWTFALEQPSSAPPHPVARQPCGCRRGDRGRNRGGQSTRWGARPACAPCDAGAPRRVDPARHSRNSSSRPGAARRTRNHPCDA